MSLKLFSSNDEISSVSDFEFDECGIMNGIILWDVNRF